MRRVSYAHRLDVPGSLGCQREKQLGALNSRGRPHIYFWNVSSNELMWLGPFSQRGQKFQTDSKPVVFHAFTINDTCLGTDSRLPTSSQHGVPWEPDIFRTYPHPTSPH